MARIRHPKDFWAGILFIAMGGAAFILALDYAMGTAGRMGPGYFPRTLGMLLAGLGLLLVVRSFRITGEKIDLPTLKPLIIILISVALFGLTVNDLGLVLSSILVVLVSSTAAHDYRWKESIVAALALAAFCVAAFRYGLGLQLPTWPPMLMG